MSEKRWTPVERFVLLPQIGSDPVVAFKLEFDRAATTTEPSTIAGAACRYETADRQEAREVPSGDGMKWFEINGSDDRWMRLG